MAAKTVQFNSDARFALRLFRNAAAQLEESGARKLTPTMVNKAFATTKTEIERGLLARLGMSQLLVLAAMSRAAQAAVVGGSARGLHIPGKNSCACGQTSVLNLCLLTTLFPYVREWPNYASALT